MRIYFGDLFQQSGLIFRQSHMFTVHALGFAGFCESEAIQDRIRISGQRQRFFLQFTVPFPVSLVASGNANNL